MAVLLKESATFRERVVSTRSDPDRFPAGVITFRHKAAMVKSGQGDASHATGEARSLRHVRAA
jgi:hypothetical protein